MKARVILTTTFVQDVGEDWSALRHVQSIVDSIVAYTIIPSNNCTLLSYDLNVTMLELPKISTSQLDQPSQPE